MSLNTAVDAELFRQSHCDRQDRQHQCIGVISIDRNGMDLNCQLCGHGDHNLEDVQILVQDAIDLLRTAGFNYHDLDQQHKRAFLKEVLALKRL